MPNRPNSEFHKMLKQITESHNKEMSKIYDKRYFVPPIVFNIDLPRIEAPKIDLDLKSLNITNLLGDYFKENSLSETMKKAVSDSIKNIDFDSFKLYSDNDQNSNEEVIKIGDYKVSSYTDVSRTTYVKLSPPIATSETIMDNVDPKKDEIIKDYTPLIDFFIQLNHRSAFSFEVGHNMYSIFFDGTIPPHYLVLIYTLHFIVAWVLVEAKHKLETKLDKKEKE